MKSNTRVKVFRLNQRGMSLVELLVALTISLVILGGIYQVFVSSTTTYRENEQFARLQENARFAMAIIGRDLRMAGYTGCANLPAGSIVNTLNDTSFEFDFNVGVQGFDYVDPLDGNVVVTDFSPTLHSSIELIAVDDSGANAPLVEGSDVLTIRRVDGGDPILVESEMPDSSADLKVTDNTDDLQNNDIVMISDCTNAAIFQITNYTVSNGNVVHNSGGGATYGTVDYPGNATKNLGKSFPIGSEIVKLNTMSYLIRLNGAGVPSLYSSDYDGDVELIEGVERMQVRYGIDTDGDRQVDSYVPASGAAGDWSQIVAVRVALLMQGGIEPKAPVDSASYDLDGDGAAEYDPADERRMRRVFKATFALRNRVS